MCLSFDTPPDPKRLLLILFFTKYINCMRLHTKKRNRRVYSIYVYSIFICSLPHN